MNDSTRPPLATPADGRPLGANSAPSAVTAVAELRNEPASVGMHVYKPLNKVRFVTAASLFDGHDASINIMRRILQATGCEVIHLGHNRSVEEIVNCALQEDAHAIAVSSYQGGHVEYF